MKKKIVALLMCIVSVFSTIQWAFASEIKEQEKAESRVICIGEVGESGLVEIPIILENGQEGCITVEYQAIPQGKNNGDPVIAGIYTVSFKSPMTWINYKVNTSSEGKITKAYDLDYFTVHNIREKSLTWTSYRAHLNIEFQLFSVGGSSTG